MSCQQKLNDEQDKYVKVFQQLDQSGDGVLTIGELKRGLKALTGQDVSDADCVEMFQGVDQDDDHKCTCDEFVKEMCKTPRKQAFEEEFKRTDADGSGKLDKAEVMKIFKIVNPKGITDEELEEIFKAVDVNGDGVIDYNEFMNMC